MQHVKTLLADNHRIFLKGLKTVLLQDPNYQHQFVGCTSSGQQAIDLCLEQHPDLLIMDLNLRDKHGLEVITQIRQKNGSSPRILVVTAQQDPKVLSLILDQGANGYLPKCKDELDLYHGIEAILAGDVYRVEPLIQNQGEQLSQLGLRKALISEGFVQKHRLTKRETQILQLISQALSNKEIGRKLFISDQTVSVHRKNIMHKLGVHSTASLIKMTYEHSWG